VWLIKRWARKMTADSTSFTVAFGKGARTLISDFPE
jgi:hypothetical protein